MKICVLNGSPKGKFSVTFQSILYLEKKFKDVSFNFVHVAQKIKYYEKHFQEVEEAITNADVVLFSYPVYTFLAPSQLHKCIHLLKQSNIDLSNIYASQITTSKHFYDVSAHKYIEQNCYDLKLKYIHGLSADMDDLTTLKGEDDLVKYFNYLLYSVTNDIHEPSKLVESNNIPYISSFENIDKTNNYSTVIITDATNEDSNVLAMIDDFKAIYPYHTKTINIADYPFAGGCLGCLSCTSSAKCIYKDNFDEFLRSEIIPANAIVYAFKIKDHSMGPIFKCYDDRQFCNGHRTMTIGTPMAYLIDGNYDGEHNLKTVIEGRCEVGHNFLCGVVNDSTSMKTTVSKLTYALENNYYLPQNFYGVGGRKIFRDLIYVMRGIMKADHAFYTAHGVYDDLPHKQKKRMLLMMLVGSLMDNPKLKVKIKSKMMEAIISPYKKVIDKLN